MARDPWDVSERPHTKAKLRLLSDYFGRWLIIWNGPRQREWAAKDWYVIDMFAGQGRYRDADGTVRGSPLVYLERVNDMIDKLRAGGVHVHILLMEKKRKNFAALQANVNDFLDSHPGIGDVATVTMLMDDSNSETAWAAVARLPLKSNTPAFLLVDPYGFAIRRETMDRLVLLPGRKDLLFNYMVSGVKRAEGIAAKPREALSRREETTLATYVDFLGQDVVLGEDADSPQEYADAAFVSKGYYVVAYDMDYPDRAGTLYYLLFVTKNKDIADMARGMFGESKKQDFSGQLCFWSSEQLKAQISWFPPKDSA
ncbi:MAG: three-Cys-motif partner protein TcmP [Coriobacteriia bacterium]|nr:three-Cys-motif partner protein TcmP [Coriobacteriia bacterium]